MEDDRDTSQPVPVPIEIPRETIVRFVWFTSIIVLFVLIISWGKNEIKPKLRLQEGVNPQIDFKGYKVSPTGRNYYSHGKEQIN